MCTAQGRGLCFNIFPKGLLDTKKVQEHQGPIRLATGPPDRYLKPPFRMTLSQYAVFSRHLPTTV